MATIYIDNKAYEVDESKNLLEVSLELGFNLPYFCWHPEMGSVGACRQCAVKRYKDENDTEGQLIMSCMEPASDQTRISIHDQDSAQFRKNIIEGLMLSHPHDCPTCDEGGECHLQDMTVMTGHNYRFYNYNKNTWRNQDLGPFINHEMNRCITCYRCVRFYREFAGGRDLNAHASNNRVFFGRHEDGPLENEFSGNLAEVCPTGVFTDKTYKKHYTRKWDLTTAPSICHQCSLGCNTIPGERYGKVRRVEPRYNGEVNGYFLCDRGRFGYEYVNNDERIRFTLKRKEDGQGFDMINRKEGLEETAKHIQNSSGLIGIGSPRASLECNYALRKLVGEDNFYSGISKHEHELVDKARDILKKGPAKTPSLRETQKADSVFVLGEDLTNTAPMLALYLRQTVKTQPREWAKNYAGIPDWHEAGLQNATYNMYGPLYVATPSATKLDDVATQTHNGPAEEIARLGFQVAHKINSKAPAVKGISKEQDELAGQIAEDLKKANQPLISSGTSMGSKSVMEAAANIAWALSTVEQDPWLTLTVPEVNSMGLSMIGGKSLDEAIAANTESSKTLVILENDLYRRTEHSRVDEMLKNAEKVLVLDHHENPTAEKADLALPSGSFAESDGTMVNNEGRAQRFYQVYPTEDDIHEGWRWLREIMATIGREDIEDLVSLDDFTQNIIDERPEFEGMDEILPPPGHNLTGQKIPRAPHRYSGRTAMRAHIEVSEPKPQQDEDTPYSFTMEGFLGQPQTNEYPFFWSPGWNSPQAVNKYQLEIGGALQGGDPGRRLIEPNSSGDWEFFTEIPETFKAEKGSWWVQPLHHIFGSEETSMKAETLSQRAPEIYVALNAEDAQQLKLEDGSTSKVEINDRTQELKVRIFEEMPQGVAGLPIGLPEFTGLQLPAWAKIQSTG